GICGVEPGPGYDGVSYTLSILCLAHTLVLGFNSRDALLAWDARVRYSLGEVHRFSVNVEPGTKLESGPASLHLCNNLLVLTRGLPPVVIGHWKLSAIASVRCCSEWLRVRGGDSLWILGWGITPSRAPHGLQPSLPDFNSDPALAEERISQEASELEKRLSMLSQCSLASSTASSYSCSTSVAGDDHSSLSSSSSSQSDASYGSRLPFWVEPLARPHLSNETASSSSTLKALTSSDDRLYAAVMGGSGTRPSLLPAPSSCSHASQRHSEEYQIPSLLRLRYDTPRSLFQTLSLKETSAQGDPPDQGRDSRSSGNGGGSQGLSNSSTGLRAQHQAMMQRSLSWGSERATSVDSEGTSTPRPPLAPGGLVCAETQCNQGLDNYITPEQWRSVKNRCLTQVSSSPQSGLSPSADTQDPPLHVREEHEDSVDVGNKLAGLRRSLASPPPSVPPPLPVALIMYRPTSACGVFQSPCEAPLPVSLDARLHSDSTVNYVNIPISPLPARTNRELLYTELDLLDPGSAPVPSPHSAVREEGSIRYAHLDITAMETAQRVGAEHVQGREDRLTQLESRRRGPPH
ncbi:protein Dok-7-like protein, partial [Lates japonicus]